MGQDASAPISEHSEQKVWCKPCGQCTRQWGDREQITVKIDCAALPPFTNEQKENMKLSNYSDVTQRILRDCWDSASDPACKAEKTHRAKSAKQCHGHSAGHLGNSPVLQEPITPSESNLTSVNSVYNEQQPDCRGQLQKLIMNKQQIISQEPQCQVEREKELQCQTEKEREKELQCQAEKESEKERRHQQELERVRFEQQQQRKEEQLSRERQEWLRRIEEEKRIEVEQAKREEEQREQKRLELNRVEANEWMRRNGFKDSNQPVRKRLSKVRPLHWAVQMHDAEAILLLLEVGADPTLLNGKNQTPLELAKQLDKAAPGQNKEPLKPWQTPQPSQIVVALSEWMVNHQKRES